MRRRRLAHVALVLILTVLAGCGGFVADVNRETVTPAPVPADDDRSTTGQTQVAPGMTADRLVDAATLLRAHDATLRNTSFTARRQTVRWTTRGTVQSAWQSTVRHNTTVVRVRHRNLAGDDGTAQRIERWSVDGQTYTAVTRDGDTTYTSSSVAHDELTLDATSYESALSSILARLSPSVAPPIERDGTTVYPLRATAGRDLPPLQNVTFLGYVRSDGVVTEFSLTYETDSTRPPTEVTVYATVSSIGRTDVESPEWVPTAVRDIGCWEERPDPLAPAC